MKTTATLTEEDIKWAIEAKLRADGYEVGQIELTARRRYAGPMDMPAGLDIEAVAEIEPKRAPTTDPRANWEERGEETR